MPRSTLAAIALVAAGLSAGLPAPCSASVRVLENTAQRFVFEWALDSFEVAPAGGVGRLSSPATNIDLGEYGEPMVPAFAFHVGVPWNGSASVSVTPLEQSATTLALPLRLREDSRGVVRRPNMRFNQQWVSNGEEVRLGRLRAMYYVLRPFAYDASSRGLRVLRRARVEVVLPVARVSAPVPMRLGDAERVFSRLLLNYGTARGWGRPAAPTAMRKALAAGFPLRPSLPMARFRVGDGHVATAGVPYPEATTEENGLLRLNGREVNQALGLNAPPIDGVVLYASHKGELSWNLDTLSDGSGALRAKATTLSPLLRHDADGDGRLDDDDWVMAYVSGASDWRWDGTNGSYVMRVNRYDDYRTYWLAADTAPGSGMERRQVSGTPARSLTHSTAFVMMKRPRFFPEDDRKGTNDWVWEHLTASNSSFTADLPSLPGIDTDSAGTVAAYRTTLGGGAGFSMSFADSQLCDACMQGQGYQVTRWSPARVRIGYNGPATGVAYAELASISVSYQQKLDLGGRSRMSVFSPGGSGLVEYVLSGLPAGQLVYIVRVDDAEQAVSLVDTVRAGGEYRFVDSAGTGLRYQVCTDAGLLLGPQLEPYRSTASSEFVVSDLHKDKGWACDYLVVYHGDFAAQAERLVRHKHSLGRFETPRRVDIADVYREFSGGNQDPAALRDFLWYVKRFWLGAEQLSYVVFMGNGNWDMKHVSSQEPVYIPTAQEGESGSERCAEDFFTCATGVFLGRLPCMSADEAETMVDKIVTTEDPAQADLGAWRNRALLVADDDRQGARSDCIQHHVSSEKVAGVILANWPAVDMRKLYEFEYPGCGVEKPSARQALLSEIGNGVSLVNYFGHGAYYIWADERMLSTDDVATMTNERRYPSVNSLSCSVGKFDSPDEVSLSDALVRKDRGGALVSVSSTREAWASSNEDLAESLYRFAFDSGAGWSLGAAYALAREANGGCTQSSLRAYCYLGDPSIRFVNRTRGMRLAVTDAAGDALDTLKALQRVTIRGTVTTAAGQVDGAFGTDQRPAWVQVALANPYAVVGRHDGCSEVCAGTVSYALPGSPLFSSRATVRGGRFEQTLLLPKNVVFDKPGVRLTAYAWQDTIAALGWDTSLVIHGTDTSAAASSDHSGPLIALRPVDPDGSPGSASYSDRICGSLPLRCDIVLYDESGIDVVGSGPDEGVTVEIPGVLSRRNINQAFQPREGDYREWNGPFTLTEQQGGVGVYRLTITARDLLGNMSSRTVDLEVVKPEAFSLDHVFNYPNPMRMGQGTRFYFSMPNTLSSLEGELVLRIYTLSGRLLRAIRNPQNGYAWDGRDELGNLLGPNVYLYRMVAWSERGDSRKVESPIRKLVIHPPQ